MPEYNLNKGDFKSSMSPKPRNEFDNNTPIMMKNDK